MADRWYTCSVCDAEYKVVTTVASGEVGYCPFCASELNEDGEDEYEVDDFDYE